MSGSLKEVRERIKSVNNTEQITKAMKMVSAAKLRRAQTAITKMRPYADKLNDMLGNILSNMEGDVQTSFGKERNVKKACAVIITSSRGLCGAFNTNIIKQTEALLAGEFADLYAAGNVDLICIGKKGFEYFTRHSNANVIGDHMNLFEDLSYDNIEKVAQMLMDAFEKGTYDNVKVVYSKFRNAVIQTPTLAQFLPVAKIESEESDDKMRADYIFEPDMQSLLDYLVPSIIKTQFQKFVLDTHASEHGARMTAMDSATENAKELIKELKLKYNKARQEAITNEISELVGGAAALESE